MRSLVSLIAEKEIPSIERVQDSEDYEVTGVDDAESNVSIACNEEEETPPGPTPKKQKLDPTTTRLVKGYEQALQSIDSSLTKFSADTWEDLATRRVISRSINALATKMKHNVEEFSKRKDAARTKQSEEKQHLLEQMRLVLDYANSEPVTPPADVINAIELMQTELNKSSANMARSLHRLRLAQEFKQHLQSNQLALSFSLLTPEVITHAFAGPDAAGSWACDMVEAEIIEQIAELPAQLTDDALRPFSVLVGQCATVTKEVCPQLHRLCKSFDTLSKVTEMALRALRPAELERGCTEQELTTIGQALDHLAIDQASFSSFFRQRGVPVIDLAKEYRSACAKDATATNKFLRYQSLSSALVANLSSAETAATGILEFMWKIQTVPLISLCSATWLRSRTETLHNYFSDILVALEGGFHLWWKEAVERVQPLLLNLEVASTGDTESIAGAVIVEESVALADRSDCGPDDAEEEESHNNVDAEFLDQPIGKYLRGYDTMIHVVEGIYHSFEQLGTQVGVVVHFVRNSVTAIHQKLGTQAAPTLETQMCRLSVQANFLQHFPEKARDFCRHLQRVVQLGSVADAVREVSSWDSLSWDPEALSQAGGDAIGPPYVSAMADFVSARTALCDVRVSTVLEEEGDVSTMLLAYIDALVDHNVTNWTTAKHCLASMNLFLGKTAETLVTRHITSSCAQPVPCLRQRLTELSPSEWMSELLPKENLSAIRAIATSAYELAIKNTSGTVEWQHERDIQTCMSVVSMIGTDTEISLATIVPDTSFDAAATTFTLRFFGETMTVTLVACSLESCFKGSLVTKSGLDLLTHANLSPSKELKGHVATAKATLLEMFKDRTDDNNTWNPHHWNLLPIAWDMWLDGLGALCEQWLKHAANAIVTQMKDASQRCTDACPPQRRGLHH